MNEPRKLTRKVGVLAAAAALGAGAGAGVYAATDSNAKPAAAPVAAAQPAALKKSAGLSITDIYKQDAPGVVDITVSGVSSGGGRNFDPFPFGGPSQRETQAEGSGFVLDKQGHIVTNAHVVDGASSVTVNFQNGKSVKATVVGSDDSSDLAVLKVDVPAGELTPLQLGDSTTVQPGEGVVAIGSPFGLADSITSGIVSAVGRTIDSPNGASITNAIQTDAAINHGNSGGPLIDSSGAVIGVNAQIDSDSGGNDGVGFAIPAATVKTVTAQLISSGKVEHAFLGVRISDASGGGAQVTNVQTGTPADKAGLKAGDVVTAVDGKAVSGADDLTAAIQAHKPGDEVTLTVKSGGSTKSVDVTLGARTT